MSLLSVANQMPQTNNNLPDGNLQYYGAQPCYNRPLRREYATPYYGCKLNLPDALALYDSL